MILLEVLFRYVQLKTKISESEYNNGVEKFLKTDSLLKSEIPVQLLNLVKGVEIWLTVSLYLLYKFFNEYMLFFIFTKTKK